MGYFVAEICPIPTPTLPLKGREFLQQKANNPSPYGTATRGAKIKQENTGPKRYICFMLPI
jgi:hypothetical protein